MFRKDEIIGKKMQILSLRVLNPKVDQREPGRKKVMEIRGIWS